MAYVNVMTCDKCLKRDEPGSENTAGPCASFRVGNLSVDLCTTCQKATPVSELAALAEATYHRLSQPLIPA